MTNLTQDKREAKPNNEIIIFIHQLDKDQECDQTVLQKLRGHGGLLQTCCHYKLAAFINCDGTICVSTKIPNGHTPSFNNFTFRNLPLDALLVSRTMCEQDYL